MAKKSRSVYVCQSCGHNAARWFGRCAACSEWNTCVEERPQEVDKRREHLAAPPRAEFQAITAVDDQDHERLQIGIGEFDRVLGGGIMPGSVILVGGDPGIGKSTILLQMAGQLSASNLRIAYVSAEESVESAIIQKLSSALAEDEKETEAELPGARSETAAVWRGEVSG